MGIENLKRWHWAMIGVLVGVALGWVWVWQQTGISGLRSAEQREFERDIVLKHLPSGQPLIKDIVIHPPEESFDGMVNVVTFKRLAQDRRGRFGWLNMRLVAKIPYKPVFRMVGTVGPELTIDKYLTELAKQRPTVRFRYAWWLVPRNGMILGGVVGLVLIGGIWPSLLNLMLGAGLGPKPKPKPATGEKPLWKYKSAAPAVDSPTKPAVTAEDQQRLLEVTEAYEHSLREEGLPLPQTAGPADAASAQTQVRKLEAGPLQQAPKLPQPGEEDEIEVKGEYYPVLIHHPKKKPQTDQKSDSKPPG